MKKITLPKDVYFLKKNKVCEYVGYSPAHIQRLEKAGKFPSRIKIGANRVVWVVTDIEAWMNQKYEETMGANQP